MPRAGSWIGGELISTPPLGRAACGRVIPVRNTRPRVAGLNGYLPLTSIGLNSAVELSTQ